MRILVTGGTGLLGNNILRQLAADRPDHSLTALVRSQPKPQVFAGLDVSCAIGDLGDEETFSAIRQAVADCDVVIHSAALIHIGWQRMEESMRVNRDGTAMIVEACIEHDKPIVHIGTVDTLALGAREKPASETTRLNENGSATLCSYVASKRAGVDVVKSAVRRGLQALIIHPGFMLGPWDWKPSSGQMIVEVAKTWRPLAPSGGCSLCDARDVAAGTIAAMDAITQPRPTRPTDSPIKSGREYILAGENWTYFELWREIAKRTGARKPIMPAGPGQILIGEIAASMLSKISANEGVFNSAALEMSTQFHWYDSQRAHDELGYRIRDPSISLDDAVDWIQNRFPTQAGR
ncbi:NAD-dependent epimerase/dehydratase family protein [Rubripirellula reticaptiva]|uniref:dTDP-glucose 4,6-dehydratase n=1 Tax=Rubripirellula reticaptiva TaxID=2528013 RepID=A0A5C6ELL1_9BACT|nr:NAD-dependent epimerase/dehydratase family protein [Rubripirellula reticaptiva]TWU48169.1 dTDP-glucose 4,6-dehydratase [Rubripirellula reticaptiva]